MAKFSANERELIKEYRQAQKFIRDNTIKSVVETPDGDVIIPIRSVVFNSKGVSDDRFSPDADFGHPAASNTVSVYFQHGKDRLLIAQELLEKGYNGAEAILLAEELAMGKQWVGVGERSKIDKEALYYNLIISRRNKYKNMIKRLAEEGHLDSSTGVKFRENDPDDKHLIKTWHLADLTLTPEPDDPNASVVQEDKEGTVMPDDTEKKVDSGDAEKKETRVNPLIEKINAAFQKPEDTEKSTDAISPTAADTLVEILTKMQASIDAIATSQTALTEKTVALDGRLTTIHSEVSDVQEAMPLLIEKLAGQMSGDVAALVEKNVSRSTMEKAIDKKIKDEKKPNTIKPGYGTFPAGAPGGD